MVLDLAVLHGAAPQVVIQLCGIDGCAALLILGGVFPDPEVDVLGEETAHSPGLGCSQRDQVRDQLAFPLLLPHWHGENAACSGSRPLPPCNGPYVDLLCGSSSGSPDSSPHLGKVDSLLFSNKWSTTGTFSNLDCRLSLVVASLP